MVTWNTSEKSKQILASLENQKHNDTIMLAVYFSLPQAAWQNVTVKSSRHERLTDVYFAIRLRALLLKDFYTCRGMLLPNHRQAAGPGGNPTAFDQVGARGFLCQLPETSPAPSTELSFSCKDLHPNHQIGKPKLVVEGHARREGLNHIRRRTQAHCILGPEKILCGGTNPELGWRQGKFPLWAGVSLNILQSN